MRRDSRREALLVFCFSGVLVAACDDASLAADASPATVAPDSSSADESPSSSPDGAPPDASADSGANDAGSGDAGLQSDSSIGDDAAADSSVYDAGNTPDAARDAVKDAALDAAMDAAPTEVQDASPTDANDSGPSDGEDSAIDAGPDWLAADASAADPEVVAAILLQECPMSTETDMCFVCEDVHCCDTYAAYAKNPEAIAFKTCFAECDESASKTSCEERCHALHTSGTSDWAKRQACLTVFCFDSDACGNQPLDDCSKCLNTKCRTESVAQSYTMSGFLLQGCISACGSSDENCQNACLATYPNAVRDVWRLDDCRALQCPSCPK